MSRRLPPIPARLRATPFSVAEGLAAGLSPKSLRGPQFEVPFPGVRRLREAGEAGEGPLRLRDRVLMVAEAYLPKLRVSDGELFSHTTALHIYGAPIRAPSQLHLAAPDRLAHARSRGVIAHRVADAPAPRPVAGDDRPRPLPCVPPSTALIQSAPLLSFREQVVAADHLIKLRGPSGRRRPGLATLEELRAAAEESNARGILRLRAALSVARVGAESRMESLQHFELASMGIDVLELQVEIYDEHGRIGRFDGVDRERKRILEYDGEQHRTDREQYLHDEERLDRARGAGYEVKRTHAEQFRPSELARTRRMLCDYLELQPRELPRTLGRYFAEPY